MAKYDKMKSEFIDLPGGELLLVLEHGTDDAEAHVLNKNRGDGAFASHGPDVKSCLGGLAAGFRALAADLDVLATMAVS